MLGRVVKPYPPDSVAALEILPGVPDALADLKAAGFLLLVVTNQPDVAKGIQRCAVVPAIHQRLQAELPLDPYSSVTTRTQTAAIAANPHQDCSKRRPHAMGYTYLSALWWEIGGGMSMPAAGRAAGPFFWTMAIANKRPKTNRPFASVRSGRLPTGFCGASGRVKYEARFGTEGQNLRRWRR